MPRKDMHDWFEFNVTGKVTGISEVMDSYSPELHSHHRALLHSEPEIQMLAFKLQTAQWSWFELYRAGLIHIWLDDRMEQFQGQLRKLPANQRPSGRGLAQERQLKDFLAQYQQTQFWK